MRWIPPSSLSSVLVSIAQNTLTNEQSGYTDSSRIIRWEVYRITWDDPFLENSYFLWENNAFTCDFLIAFTFMI